MKIYIKVLIVSLPLVIISLLIGTGLTYSLSHQALQGLAEKWLEARLSETVHLAEKYDAILPTFNLENPDDRIKKARTLAARHILSMRINKNGYPEVINAAGRLMVHPDPRQVGRDVSGESWFQEMVHNQKGQFIVRWQNEKRLVAYRYLPKWRLYFTVNDSAREVYGPIDRIWLYLLLLTAASAITLALIMAILAERLTAPLRLLAAGAEQIGRGNLDATIPVRSRDELGNLARTFNDMAARLKQSQEELHEKQNLLLDTYHKAHIGHWWHDLTTGEIYWSEEFFRILGIEPQKPTNELALSVIHPDDLHLWQTGIEESAAGQMEHEHEFRIVRPDGDIRWIYNRWLRVNDANGKEIKRIGTHQDITERKRAEQAQAMLNRWLLMLSETSLALIHITDEKVLLSEVCRIVADVGGYRLAWIGFVEHDEGKTLRPVAHAGFDSGYIDSARVSWGDNERGRGPGGVAIRTGKPSLIRNIQTDPAFAPWREAAIQHGYQSIIALPLIQGDVTYGAIGIYSDKANAFNEQEVDILTELAGNLAFGISTLRIREQRILTEDALIQSEEKFRSLIQKIQAAVVVHGADTQILNSNSLAQEILGLSEEQMLGRMAIDPAFHFYHEDGSTMPPDKYPVNMVLATGQTLKDYVVGIHRPDRATANDVWVLVNAVPIFDVDGKIDQVIVTFIDITERKKTEEELRKNEIELREAQRVGRLGSWDWDATTDTITWSEEYYHIYGFDPNLPPPGYEEHLKAYTPESMALLDSVVRRNMETGEPYEVDLELANPSGPTRWITARSETKYDESGRIIGLRGTAQDITDRKRNEAVNLTRLRLIQFSLTHSVNELLEETLNVAEALTNSLIGFFHFVDDDQENLTLQNWSTRTKEQFCKAERSELHYPIASAGVWVECIYSKKPVIHNDFASLPHRKGMPEGHAEVIRELVVPVMRGDKITAVLGIGNKAIDYHEKDIEIVSLLADLSWEIVERKLAEEKILRSDQRLRLHSEHSPLGFLEWDERFCAVEWNAACERIFGYTREEAIGRHAKELILPPQVHHLVDGIYESLMSQRGGQHSINENTTRDGRTIICEWFNTTLIDKDDKAIGVASVCRDITDQKKMEAELDGYRQHLEELIQERTAQLERARNKAQQYLDIAGVILVAIGTDRRITLINQSGCEALGGSSSEILGKDWFETFIPEKVRKEVLQGFSLLMAGEMDPVEYFENPIVTLNGEERLIAWHNALLRDEAGSIIGTLSSGEDITENKLAEVQIRTLNQNLQERAAALETANRELESFAYSVSHDLRAPLRHIDGFLDLLQKRILDTLDETSLHYMTTISNASRRMGLLIDDLLSYSRMGRFELSKQSVDLGSLVQEVIREFEIDTKDREIEWRIAELPAVTGDRTMLRMVLANLISNALKFTRTRECARIEIGREPDQGNQMVFFIRDNGVGFDPSFSDKLFSVFQRLHREEEFEGTGIGLANVRQIIHRHDGRAWARGEPERGATFYFSLPANNK